jgi:hypothetical protein
MCLEGKLLVDLSLLLFHYYSSKHYVGSSAKLIFINIFIFAYLSQPDELCIQIHYHRLQNGHPGLISSAIFCEIYVKIS